MPNTAGVLPGGGGGGGGGGAGADMPVPADLGWLAWTWNPYVGGQGLGASTYAVIYASLVKVPADATWASISMWLGTAQTPALASADGWQMGLYSAGEVAGGSMTCSLVASTADGAWPLTTPQGFLTLPLSPALAVSAGEVYYAAFLFQGNYHVWPAPLEMALGAGAFSAWPPVRPLVWNAYPGPYSSLPTSLPVTTAMLGGYAYWMAMS